jgi:outer membrane protein OmpA-like peptidoglycan-associated protein
MVSMISGSFGVGAAIGYLQSELVANKSELEKFSTFAEDDVRRKEKVETKSTFVEFYPHFRPGENWQIGPVARAVLSPYQNSLPEESRKKQTIFAGALVGFEFPSDRWIYRIGGQYLTDINLERRSLQHFQISLDIGYSFLERFSKIVERKKIEKREERIKNVVEKNIEKKVILKQVSIIFDQGTINFVTAKADLLPASIAKLQKLSRFLTSRPDLWERVLIEGHTDRRGAFDYNIKLSQDRAISVGQALIQNGVQQSKISWQGFGYSRPLDPGDSEVAWARNRRVELKFEGVADEDALKAGVSEAMAGN